MPYVNMNTSKKMDEAQKDLLKTKLGSLISILPGKSESVLMVNIHDGETMYFGGKKGDIAFVEVKLFKESDMESKKEFTQKVFNLLTEEFAIPQENIFINITEHMAWGAKGVFKS